MTSGSENAERETSQVERELRRMNSEWVEALVQGDTATLDRIVAEDFTFTYPLEGDSKAQFIADVASGDLRVETLSRDLVEVRVYGHTAVVSALDTAKWRYKGQLVVPGYYRTIHVYSERNGRWQLVLVQACPISQK